MKTKTLYIIIFILAVIIILFVKYSKDKISEINPPVVQESQVETRQPEAMTQSAAVEPVFFSQQAVTVIKPAQKKQQAVSEIDTAQDIQYSRSSRSSGQSSSVASGGDSSQDTDKTTDAGVTRSGKYPTKEEMKEMNSRGIVMY